MADVSHKSDPFKIPGGNPSGAENKSYYIDIPTLPGEKKGTNPQNTTAMWSNTKPPQYIGSFDVNNSFTSDKNYLNFDANGKRLNDAEIEIRKSEISAIRSNAINIRKQVIDPTAKKAGIDPPIKSNTAATPPGTGSQQGALDQDQVKFIEEDLKKVQSRSEYNNKEPIIYPIGLKVKYQDCIKFSIVKYNPSGLKGFGEGNRDLRRINVSNGILSPKGRKKDIIGTIVLPIPGGITDSNRVGWSDLKVNDLDQALGKLFTTAVTGGDAAKNAQQQATAAAKEGSGARTAIVGKIAESVIGTEGLMQRQFGAIINPNLELLFSSPDLRQFSFSFKLSPRSSKEAEIVRKIIRAFKQAMSVKRSTSSFLLQTPHTFAISYIFKDQNHPYLNRFKECALTSCNVNYTPEATYMSFEDGAMASYQLDLTFQELEPIYDDDYTDLDQNQDTQIGY